MWVRADTGSDWLHLTVAVFTYVTARLALRHQQTPTCRNSGMRAFPDVRGTRAAQDRVMATRKRSLRAHWLRLFFPLGALAVLLGGGGLAAFEAEAARTYGEGVLWSLSLMTTVGFVGGVPTTVGGKIIAAVLMLLGFSFLAMTTAAVASLFVREDEAPFEKREAAYERKVLEELRELHARLDQIEDHVPGRTPHSPVSR